MTPAEVVVIKPPAAEPPSRDIRRRLLDYRKKAARLRSINSIKLTRYQFFANLTTASLVALSSTVTFFGFAGIVRLHEYARWLDKDISRDQTELAFNILLLAVVILVIVDLIYQFRERANRHNHAIVLLANFVNDLDDQIARLADETDATEEQQVLTTTAARYEIMTEFLPFNTDREYRRSKRRETSKPARAADVLERAADAWSDDLVGHQRLAAMIAADDWRLDLLRVVRDTVPGAVVAGGFVRGAVWDALSGFRIPTQLDDVDVLLYDPAASVARDATLEDRLRGAAPGVRWQVSNQAHAHGGQASAGARTLEDALGRAPETANSVGLRLDAKGQIEILSPHGTEDLFRMIVRCPPGATSREVERFTERLGKKSWSSTWPKVVVVSPP
jgi:hypothetical protein